MWMRAREERDVGIAAALVVETDLGIESVFVK
jgi:hypothetical protein